MTDLQEMTDNEDHMMKMILSFPQLSQMTKDREDLCLQSEQLAGTQIRPCDPTDQ